MCSASHPSLRPSQLAILQRETFLAEQRVAAVAAADRPDRVVLREMADEAPLGIEIERAMQSAVEIVGIAQHFERRAAHPRHDSHAERDIDAVGDFDADLGERRAERTHHVRNDVHRAAAHRAVEQRAELAVGLVRRHPVVGDAGVVLGRCADEGDVLGAGDIVRVRAMQIAAGAFFLIERNQDPGRYGLLVRRSPLGLGPSHQTMRRAAVSLRGLGDPLGECAAFSAIVPLSLVTRNAPERWHLVRKLLQ